VKMSSQGHPLAINATTRRGGGTGWTGLLYNRGVKVNRGIWLIGCRRCKERMGGGHIAHNPSTFNRMGVWKW